jgi:hypothetical protein
VKWTGMYLVGFVILLGGLLAALWKLGILASIGAAACYVSHAKEECRFLWRFTVTVFLRRIAFVVCRHASTGLDGTGWPSQVRFGRLRVPFFVGV